MKISLEKLRASIKFSSFSMQDIARVLDMSERNLYFKLKNETLRIDELNTIIRILNIDVNEIVE